MSAVRIGRPIAISEPNATSSTMIAASTPTISLAGMAASPNQLPANSTRTPCFWIVSAARSLMSFAVCVGCEPLPLAVVIPATAIFPPGDTRTGSTSMTPLTSSTFARKVSIASRCWVTSANTI